MRGTVPGPALGGLMVLAALPGCYGYGPVQAGPPRPGAEVRATLTPAEAGRAGRSGDVVEGVVQAADGRTLTLSVRRPELRGVQRFGTVRDTVTLSRGGIRDLEERRLKPVPTAAVAVGAAGGMVGLFVALMEGAGRASDGGVGGGDPMLLLRIPLGR